MNNQLRSVLLAVSAGTLTWALTGCGSLERGDVARQWTVMMREQQINPVFPPRNDVHVGDVYVDLTKYDAEGHPIEVERGFLPVPVALAHVPVEKQLNAYYGGRPYFPATPIANVNPSAVPTAAMAQPAADAEKMYTTGDTKHLREAGFPEFFSATFTSADISALIPAEALSIGAAGGFQTSSKAKVSIPVVETCGLPANIIWGAAVSSSNRLQAQTIDANGVVSVGEVPTGLVLGTLNRPMNGQGGSPAAGTVLGHLTLVTEVYYTRAIDISWQRSSTGGATATVQTVVPAPANGSAPFPASASGGNATNNNSTTTTSTNTAGNSTNTGTTTNTTSSTNTANTANGSTSTTRTDPPDPQKNAELLLTNLNRQLDAVKVPGGKVQFVAAGAGGVSMRRTFERPIAIGVRGLSLEVRSAGAGQSYTVSLAGAMGGTGVTVAAPIKDPTNPEKPPAEEN